MYKNICMSRARWQGCICQHQYIRNDKNKMNVVVCISEVSCQTIWNTDTAK